MILKSLTGSAFASLAMFTAAFAQGPDLEREQRLADQIVDDIFDGEPVMLKAGEHEFLSIYTEAGEGAAAALLRDTLRRCLAAGRCDERDLQTLDVTTRR